MIQPGGELANVLLGCHYLFELPIKIEAVNN